MNPMCYFIFGSICACSNCPACIGYLLVKANETGQENV